MTTPTTCDIVMSEQNRHECVRKEKIMRKNIFTSYEQYSRYSESLERSFERLIDVRSYCNRKCKNILIH